MQKTANNTDFGICPSSKMKKRSLHPIFLEAKNIEVEMAKSYHN